MNGRVRALLSYLGRRKETAPASEPATGRASLPANRANVQRYLAELARMTEPATFADCMRRWEFHPTRLPTGLSSSSPEFRAFQMALYEEVSGRSAYDAARDEQDTVLEVSDQFTVYPFTTGDPVAAGSYLVGTGLALRAMQVRPGGTIVEYGIGWGHTTLALAQLGYQVIAVDIERKFLDLVERRARRLGLQVRTHHGLFGDLPDDVDSVDGVLFFECFHHCLDHVAVVERLHQRLPAGGRLVLAGEPLFDDAWFYPWGLRLDGQSVWAIGTHGWMELGFKRSYLEELLTRTGFSIERHFHPEFGCVGEVYAGIKS